LLAGGTLVEVKVLKVGIARMVVGVVGKVEAKARWR